MNASIFLRRVMRRVVRGGARTGRSHRYWAVGLAGSVAIWFLAAAYLVLTPKSYTAGFTFILPGTGAGSSMNLENLGQASTTSASAFSSPDMSPTENYRKMILSHRVISEAARTAGLPETAFPMPRIELAEMTKMIIVSLTAHTPQLATDRADILRRVFLETLDKLRNDEIVTRDNAERDMLDGYRRSLQQARDKLIQHQVKTGLVSLEQYNGIVASVEHLREQLLDVEARLAQSRSGVEMLTKQLGTTPDAANLAMVLRADPFFQTDLDSLAKNDAEIASVSGTRGDANAHLQDLRAEQASLETRLLSRSAELTGHRSVATSRRLI
jgi:uncharacterized protein involved in exopolysaccharide biosynthesis